MRLSKQLFQDRFEVPKDYGNMKPYELLHKLHFVEFQGSGIPLFHPIGQMLMQRVQDAIRKEAQKKGYSEMMLPLLQDSRYLKSTGRHDTFESELMRINAPTLEDYILTPTNEELFLEIAKRGLQSYRQLPVHLFQIARKYRNNKRSKGLYRTREFLMCDMVSLNDTDESLAESANRFEQFVDALFKKLELRTFRVEKKDGRYVDYLVPSQEGEYYLTIGSDGRSASYSHELPQGQRDPAEKASSMAMYFLFDKKSTIRPQFLDESGDLADVHLGTYGIGIQRCVLGVIEQHRDSEGIAFPKAMRPFDASIVVIDPSDPNQEGYVTRLYEQLIEEDIHVLLDDRHNRQMKRKAEYSDFLGIPYKIVVGKKEVTTGTVTLKERKSRRESIIQNSDLLPWLKKNL